MDNAQETTEDGTATVEEAAAKLQVPAESDQLDVHVRKASVEDSGDSVEIDASAEPTAVVDSKKDHDGDAAGSASEPITIDDTINMEAETQERPAADANDNEASSPPNDMVDASDDSDGDASAFALLASRKRKRKKSKLKPIISIGLPPPSQQDDKAEENAADFVPNVRALDFMKEEEEICYDFDFEDSKEHTDSRTTSGNHLHTVEAALLAEKEADVAKIQAYLKAKWDESTKDVQNQVNLKRAEISHKQERQRTQLADNYKRKLAEDERGANEGIKWLKREQKKELEMKMLEHQQNLQKGGLDQDNASEWDTFVAQLQARHEEQIKQFEEKKRARRAKAEKEFRDQIFTLSNHHKKRQAEADRQFQDTHVKKCFEKQERLKAKLWKLHTERYDKKLFEIGSKRGTVDMISRPYVGDTSSPAGITCGDSFDSSICHHAVTRHKRRKASTNNSSFGMSIEIHNEGIIIMTKSAAGSDHSVNSAPRTNNVFLPWSTKVRKILHSIMCGEIPSCSEINLNNLSCSGKQDLDGGMVRCVITDMRTSEDTAICQRAETFVNHLLSKNGKEMEDLRKQQSSINKQIESLEREYKIVAQAEEAAVKSEEEAIAAHNDSRDTWAMFKNQAQHFFNNDGSCTLTVSQDNKSKLLGAMRKYKEDYETTKNQLMDSKKQLESARMASFTKNSELKKLKEKGANIDKMMKALKRGSSPSKIKTATADHPIDLNESSGRRVDNVISSIHAVAEKRRSIVNKKKTNGNMCADWGATVDGVDAIDIGTKKSIWQKMQRKRVNTVLRPSHHNIVKNLVKATKSSTVDCFDMGNGDGTVNPSVKAEELLLLALHPEAPGSFSSTPDNEPGWHICLDTPQRRNPHSILHTDQVGIVSQTFLSVCCSTGRQSASFLERHHLRTLNDETPLSFVTKASALAETNPTCRTKATQDIIDADPLTESDEQRQLGLSFVVRDEMIKEESPTKKTTAKKHKPESQPKKNEKLQKKAKSSSTKKKDNAASKGAAKSRKKSKEQEQPAIQPLATSARNSMEQMPQSQFKNPNTTPTDQTSQQPSVFNHQQQQQHFQQQNFQQQFQNFFHQNPLVHGTGGMALNPQQQMSFLQAQSMNQAQQQQQFSLTQPQMAQLMQQNMMGNNAQQNTQQRLNLSQSQMAQLLQQNAQMQNIAQNQAYGQSQFQHKGGPGDKK